MSNISDGVLEIIPSLGTQNKTWEDIEKKLEIAKGFAKIIHVDIVDGKFAETLTFMDPKPFAKYKDDFILEVHLMTENPLQYLKAFAEAGFQRFIAHIEKIELVEEFVAEGELLGEVGIAIDGDTHVSALDSVSLEDLDSILVLTVKNAGLSGQEFAPDMLEKVKEIKERLIFEQAQIEVDGGINEDTILQAKEAGANRFVVTSYIFESEDPKAAYEKLESLLRE